MEYRQERQRKDIDLVRRAMIKAGYPHWLTGTLENYIYHSKAKTVGTESDYDRKAKWNSELRASKRKKVK